jgi:hypothetical protein
MRQHLIREDAKIKPRKAEVEDFVDSLEYTFVDQMIDQPEPGIEFTVELRNGRWGERAFSREEVRSWLQMRLLTSGPDIPLELTGAEVSFGSLVLRTKSTEAARAALRGRPGLMLTITLEGKPPFEHRVGRALRRSYRR